RLDRGDVALLDLAGFEVALHRRVERPIAHEHEHTRRPHVEPMMDSQIRVLAACLEHAREPADDVRAGHAAAVDGDAARLVDDEQLGAVFEDALSEPGPKRPGERVAHFFFLPPVVSAFGFGMPPARFAAPRTTTRPSRGPGMPPRMNSRFSSGSTLTTRWLRTLNVSAPECPAMRVPSFTRPGVRRVPMEPPWRRYSCVPCVCTLPAKLWRRMTPVKPRPRETP